MFPKLLIRHRDLLIFSMYTAMFGASWYFLASWYFPDGFLLRRPGLIGATAWVFLLALFAGVMGGLIARDAERPADGFFTFLMAWLTFSFLLGCIILFLGTTALFLRPADLRVGEYFVPMVLALVIYVLLVSSVPALIGCLLYQGVKFLIVGRQRSK